MTEFAPAVLQPEALRRQIEPRQTRYERGLPLTSNDLEVLVEASFRLAVHPGTDPATAIPLLSTAHRLDPANPKHPYHVGLIYLRHGLFDAAHEWLRAAADLTPASHRIWAHLSIVLRCIQREQNSRVDDSTRRQPEQIAAAIREGRHDFRPDTPPPLLRPGRCRWSGIHDVGVEHRLQGKTNTRTRDELATELGRIAASAAQRHGGTAAFTVLAVQWMVYGYPPGTVRRLARQLPRSDGPARRLLDTVCDILECDAAELPARLARCVDEGAIPDLLAAMIHQSRLFRRPLRLPDLGAYSAARNNRTGLPGPHLSAMTTMLRALSAAPAPTMPDADATAATEVSGGSDTVHRLGRLESAAQQLVTAIEEVRKYAQQLSKTTIADADDFARVAGDRALLAETLELIEAERTERLAEIQKLKATDPTGLPIAFEEFDRRIADCESTLQDSPGSIRNILKRADKRLTAKKNEYATVEPKPSERARTIRQASAPSSDRPTPAPQSIEAGLDVDSAIAAVEHALDDNFTEAYHTLEVYAGALRHREAVTLLRTYLDGRRAEADHRMGRLDTARKRWNGMLTDNPLNSAILRNLAVAHSSAGEVGSATQAWMYYLESLYLHALLSGAPGRGALQRAEVHQVLAGSFGAAALIVRPPGGNSRETEARDVPSVLSSAAKVSVAVAHLRLEELNRALSYRSPTLLLGVGRSVGEQALASARDRRLALAATACQSLPPRIAAAFADHCSTQIEKAYRAASAASGRTRKPTDEIEEQAHANWAEQRLKWKCRIRSAVINGEADWPLTDYSGELIANLGLIDALPLAPQDEFMCRAVQHLDAGQDPAAYLEKLNKMSDDVALFALTRIFEAAEADSDGFPARFQRASRSWGRNRVPDKCERILDDPISLYEPSAKSALQIVHRTSGELNDSDRRVVAAAVPALERWVTRLPGVGGPARALARLLNALDRRQDAERVLTAARAATFSTQGRREIDFASALMDIDLERYPSAVRIARALLAEGQTDTRLRQLFVMAYRHWINADGDWPRIQDIRADLSHWDDADSLRQRRGLIAEATVAAHRSPEGIRPEPLAADLRQLCEDDGDDNEARYHLVLALYQHTKSIREQMRGTVRAERRELGERIATIRAECATNAGLLLRDPSLPQERREQVQDLLRQVKPTEN